MRDDSVGEPNFSFETSDDNCMSVDDFALGSTGSFVNLTFLSSSPDETETR